MNNELTQAIITTEFSGIFNVMITGVRKDEQALEYSQTEEIIEEQLKDY